MIKLFHNIINKIRDEKMSEDMYVNAKDSACDMTSKDMQDYRNEYENIYDSRPREEKMHVVKSNYEMHTKYQKEEFGEFVSYYCAIKDPIAEIVIVEYFPRFAKIEKLKKVFEDDFSVNYRIDIPMALIDIQCLLCFMFMKKYITSPATFGVVLSDIFYVYNPIGVKTDIEKVFEISFENYKKSNPNATEEELNDFQIKGKRKMDLYIQHRDEVQKVIEILKERIASDKNLVVEKYCKIFPLRVIEEDRYYVSYVPAKYIEQYIGDKCPKYLYYYMFDNSNKYEQEYQKVLLNLTEHGFIKSRWKNEFSLYMIIKSYFPSAIYQYHAEWLEKQSLDIYIPEHKIGIEYQGKQHYEEVGIFNGIEGFEETQKRDKIKKEKCALNGVTLIEWAYTDEVEEQKLIDILKQYNVLIPCKKDITSFYINDIKNQSEGNTSTTKRVLPKVCQYDLDGNYLNLYDSVDIAACETGVSKESIRRTCSGIRNTGGGYMWRRYFEAEIPYKIEAYSKEKQIGSPRKIIQYSFNGEIIASYDSISEAVRKTGINAKSIRETAKGKQNHAGGYIWKYADDN